MRKIVAECENNADQTALPSYVVKTLVLPNPDISVYENSVDVATLVPPLVGCKPSDDVSNRLIILVTDGLTVSNVCFSNIILESDWTHVSSGLVRYVA